MCQAVIPHIKHPLILKFDTKQSQVDEINKKHDAEFTGSRARKVSENKKWMVLKELHVISLKLIHR